MDNTSLFSRLSQALEFCTYVRTLYVTKAYCKTMVTVSKAKQVTMVFHQVLGLQIRQRL